MQRPYDSMRDQSLNRTELPIWLPILLTLIGTLGCIYTAYIAIPNTLQRTLFLPKFSKQIVTDDINKPLPINKDIRISVPVNKIVDTPKIVSDDCPPLFIFSFKQNDLEPLLERRTQKISQLRDWLTQHPDETMIVGGHSSSKGLKEPNLILSYRRAQAVHHLFIASGIPEHQLSTQAFGEEKPMAGIPSSSERNRRVSIHVKGRDECQHDAVNQ